MMARARLAVLALRRRPASDELREQAVALVDEREPAFPELIEELVPRDLIERLVLGLRNIREHDADDAYVPALMRALDGCGLAAFALGPAADRVMVGSDFAHRLPSVAR